jgi:hypothetical protein
MLECGTLECHVENIKMNQGLGEEYEVPVPWYLLTHPSGNVIFDGGNAAECAVDAKRHWDGIWNEYGRAPDWFADAGYIKRDFVKPDAPWQLLEETDDAVRSVRKLHRIARRSGSLVVTGHDPEAWPSAPRCAGTSSTG